MSKHSSLFEHLNNNLKLAYRQAIDADAILNEMLQLGVGKFNAILRPDQGFTCEAVRFIPYVEELASELEQLKGSEGEAFETELSRWIGKLEVLLKTLTEFKRNLKNN